MRGVKGEDMDTRIVFDHAFGRVSVASLLLKKAMLACASGRGGQSGDIILAAKLVMEGCSLAIDDEDCYHLLLQSIKQHEPTLSLNGLPIGGEQLRQYLKKVSDVEFANIKLQFAAFCAVRDVLKRKLIEKQNEKKNIKNKQNRLRRLR